MRNSAALFERLGRALSAAVLVRANMADLPYLVQLALFRRARLVVAMHGGALGAVPWLRPTQAVLEVAAADKHSAMYELQARAVGAQYEALTCSQCSWAHGGEVNIDAVLKAAMRLVSKRGLVAKAAEL
jgi:capsular polysaccharide biosynthesis protein